MKPEKKQQSKKRNPQKERLKHISLYPLEPEQALSAFIQIDPEKVRATKRERALSSA